MKLSLDQNFCIGCGACVVACLDAHNLPSQALLSVLEECKVENGGVVVTHSLHTCLQCVDPHCLRQCGEKAISRTPDGVVTIDEEKCIGCGSCASSCPTKSIVMKKTMKGLKALKCELCGGRPRCAEACPYEALLVL